MITNIDIDEDIVAEAMRLCGAKTKREVVDRALRELVARGRRPSIGQLFGIGGIGTDYDPKLPGARGAEAGRNRVEEPRANYSTTKKSPRRKSRTSSGRKR
jgi:Bacterial antitoxin of type II TA system, VapB